MRPKAIIWFEILYLGALAVMLLQVGAQAHDNEDGDPATIILLHALILGAVAALVLFASRRRSRVARWILVLLFGYSFYTTARSLFILNSLYVEQLVVLLMAGTAVTLTFTPSARDWLAGTPKSDKLRRTFD